MCVRLNKENSLQTLMFVFLFALVIPYQLRIVTFLMESKNNNFVLYLAPNKYIWMCVLYMSKP